MCFVVVWLALAIFSYTSEQNRKIEKLQNRCEKFENRLNAFCDAGNEHVRALQELADYLGYCVHVEYEDTFDSLIQAEILGVPPTKRKKKLVVHKSDVHLEATPIKTATFIKKPVKKVAVTKTVKSRK